MLHHPLRRCFLSTGFAVLVFDKEHTRHAVEILAMSESSSDVESNTSIPTANDQNVRAVSNNTAGFLTRLEDLERRCQASDAKITELEQGWNKTKIILRGDSGADRTGQSFTQGR